jgi:ATP-binding cassette subfamily B protein
MSNQQKLPSTIKEYIGYYWRQHPKLWLWFLFTDLIHFTRYTFAFICVGKVVDILSRYTPDQGIPTDAFIWGMMIFVFTGVGEFIHVVTAYQLTRWEPKTRANIRRDFFNYVLGHSHSYYQDQFAGSLARKVSELAESSVRLVYHVRFAIFGSLIAMTASMLAMFLAAPVYGFGMLIFLISVTLPVFLRLPKIRSRSLHFSDVRSRVSGVIVDTLSNASSMRNFARHPHEQAHLDVYADQEYKAGRKRILTMIQMENYRRLSFVVLSGGMMLALLYGWKNGSVSLGEISMIMGLSFSMVSATWNFGFGIVMSADEFGYIDDALGLVMRPYGIEDKPGAQSLDVPEGNIVFKDVTFTFPSHTVFANLNIHIKPGEKVALVGASGAGKSTLMNVLLRNYDIDNGAILIDGQNIVDVTQSSLRENISIIPQDTSLFHRTIFENIQYGQLNATREDVMNAAKMANAHEFIELLPEGYETMVGERGVKLSGGQRQRIAIARALLKRAPIVLIDEATSALDSESERLIQESFSTLMEGRTVIAIAHRLSTIASMDRILVMSDGAVVEEGSHQELLKKKNGLYQRLWTMQSGGFLGGDGHG